MDRSDRQPRVRITIPRSKKRRQHSPDLKAKVGLEALKGIEPVHAIASRYEVHPVQVSQWKQEAAGSRPDGVRPLFAAEQAPFRRRGRPSAVDPKLVLKESPGGAKAATRPRTTA